MAAVDRRPLRACYQSLTADGKPHKLARFAVMRWLPGLLATLLWEDRYWQAEPPARYLWTVT